MVRFCPFCKSNNLIVWDYGNGYCYHCHNLYTEEQIEKKRESSKIVDFVALF